MAEQPQEQAPSERLRRYIVWAMTIIVSVAAISAYALTYHSLNTDRWVLRQFFAVKGERTHPQDIILVNMDRALIEKHNGGVPRSVIADGLEKIIQGKPKLLIFDGSFPTSTQISEADHRIARSLASVPSVIGAGKHRNRNGTKDIVTIGSHSIFSQAATFEIPMFIPLTKTVVERITSNFNNSATLYERVPLAQTIPTATLDPLMKPPGPFDLINFYGPPGTIRSVTLQDVLDGSTDFALKSFSDRIVFVGFSSVDQEGAVRNSDAAFTSVSTRPMYGVEIHATTIGNLLDQSWLRQLDPRVNIGVVFLTILLLLFLCLASRSLLVSALVFPILIALTVINYILFSWADIWVAGLCAVWIVGIIGFIVGICLHGISADTEGAKLSVQRAVSFVIAANILAFIICATVTRFGFDPAHWMMKCFHQIKGSREVPQEIVIVAVDEKSISKLRSSTDFSFSRSRIDTIRRIMDSSPRAVFVDLAMFPKDSNLEEQEKVHYFSEQIRQVEQLQSLQHKEGNRSISLVLYGSRDNIGLIAPRGGPSSLNVFSDTLKLQVREPPLAPSNYYINFYNRGGNLSHISLSDILDRSHAEVSTKLHDKIVFFGLKSAWMGRGQVDSWEYLVPALDEFMFAVDIHATILGNLLDRSWIREVSHVWGVLAVLISGTLVAIIFTSFSLKLAGILLISLFAFTVFAAYLCFSLLFLWSGLLPVILLAQVIAALFAAVAKLI